MSKLPKNNSTDTEAIFYNNCLQKPNMNDTLKQLKKRLSSGIYGIICISRIGIAKYYIYESLVGSQISYFNCLQREPLTCSSKLQKKSSYWVLNKDVVNVTKISKSWPTTITHLRHIQWNIIIHHGRKTSKSFLLLPTLPWTGLSMAHLPTLQLDSCWLTFPPLPKVF